MRMTTTNQPPYILDATVAVKWFLKLQDEPYTELAARVLDEFNGRRIRLRAPIHIRSEVGHAITRAVRRNRITFDLGREALEQFNSYDLELILHTGILLAGYQLAHRFGCSFYDATYLA